jgi:phosphoribosylformimino-5-aminoimidazole carboxamide ribonucleotide (ProFAR) isomerase
MLSEEVFLKSTCIYTILRLLPTQCTIGGGIRVSEKTTELSQVTDKLYHMNWIRAHNVSSDSH